MLLVDNVSLYPAKITVLINYGADLMLRLSEYLTQVVSKYSITCVLSITSYCLTICVCGTNAIL